MTERPPVRIALVGMGRMGQALAALAPARGCEVVAQLDARGMAEGLNVAALGGAEVAIEFTTPESAVRNAERLLDLRCPVVIGTTGWTAGRDRLEAAVVRSGCAALWSPNFSIGVQLFLALLEVAAPLVRETAGFDAHLLETHHAAKQDAPSGTALAMGERLEAGLGRAVPITSVRVGSVPGTHELILDAPFEQIRFSHEARDRRVFADGALRAARWLAAGRLPALYTMRDLLGAPGGLRVREGEA
jgi:4-hydroxy-tetrahydrodipicolinate reductase